MVYPAFCKAFESLEAPNSILSLAEEEITIVTVFAFEETTFCPTHQKLHTINKKESIENNRVLIFQN